MNPRWLAVPSSDRFGATPPINDISTDTADAPVFWDMPNPTDYPGAKTAALQHAAYPDLAPLKLGLTPEQAFAQALLVAQAKGWTIVASCLPRAASRRPAAACCMVSPMR